MKIWHNESEKPAIPSLVIFVRKSDNAIFDYGRFGEEDVVYKGCKWAYMDDLVTAVIDKEGEV